MINQHPYSCRRIEATQPALLLLRHQPLARNDRAGAAEHAARLGEAEQAKAGNSGVRHLEDLEITRFHPISKNQDLMNLVNLVDLVDLVKQ